LLPHANAKLGDRYLSIVADHAKAAPEGAIVVDVGGGKRCGFAELMGDNPTSKIVAVDISGDELEHNHDVHAKVVADIVQGLPLRSRGVDLIVSRSVLEHLRQPESFVRHASRVLKPEGYFIHLFPCRFAPFAILNQMLPHRLSARVVHFLRPGSEGRLGFPAYYNNCYPTAMRSLLAKYGFEIRDLRVSFYQSSYFQFFLPFFLLSVAYELIVYALGIANLSAHILVVARKK
jgi:ubiquinone/menaquinone biosynthesis C-methylase UbiE